ncbi:MAG: hypothetical protein R3Y05_02615 [bacterium]
MKKIYDFKILNFDIKLQLFYSKYEQNEQTALCVNRITKDGIKPFGVISTNVNICFEEDEIYVKEATSITDWQEEFLTMYNIAEKIPNTRLLVNSDYYNKYKLKPFKFDHIN